MRPYRVDSLHFLIVNPYLYVATTKGEEVFVGPWESFVYLGGIPYNFCVVQA